jgi:hypothetical protein
VTGGVCWRQQRGVVRKVWGCHSVVWISWLGGRPVGLLSEKDTVNARSAFSSPVTADVLLLLPLVTCCWHRFHSQLSLQDLVHKLTHTPNLQHSATTYTYSISSSSSSSSKPRLQRAHSSGPAPAAAVASALQGLDVMVGPVGPVESYSSSCGAVHAWYTGSSSSSTAAPTQHASATVAVGGQESEEGSPGQQSEGAGQWDRRQQVLWFPQGGCWARVPAQLPSQQQQQQGAEGAAGGGLIEFEFGVIHG